MERCEIRLMGTRSRRTEEQMEGEVEKGQTWKTGLGDLKPREWVLGTITGVNNDSSSVI